jgi:hypothetical protein
VAGVGGGGWGGYLVHVQSACVFGIGSELKCSVTRRRTRWGRGGGNHNEAGAAGDPFHVVDGEGQAARQSARGYTSSDKKQESNKQKGKANKATRGKQQERYARLL